MNCKSCGAEIRFVKTESGRRIPLDWPPFMVFVIIDGVAVKRNGYRTHFVTCPNATDHQKAETVKQDDLFDTPPLKGEKD